MIDAVTAVIRFKDSAGTLPAVLAALAAQTRPPAQLLGIDTGSRDGSANLIRAAGGRVISWPYRYHHAKVLNAGLAAVTTPFALVISSHTVLTQRDGLERMLAAAADASVAAVSPMWDDDPFYGSTVTWAGLQASGIKFGSIYSNSLGLLRLSAWRDLPFDTQFNGTEDFAWALAQCQAGASVRRLPIAFSYRKQDRRPLISNSAYAHKLARMHGLSLRWLGAKSCVYKLLGWRRGDADRRVLWQRLYGYAAWRWVCYRQAR